MTKCVSHRTLQYTSVLSQGSQEEEGIRDETSPVGVAVLRINPYEFLISDYYTAGGQNAKIN